MAVRDSNGKITAIESISEEKANSYYCAADDYENQILNGLEERLEEKLKRLYPDN